MRQVWTIVLALCLSGAAQAAVVVQDGQAKAIIIVPADAPEQRQDSAALLQQYVKQSSGAELPIAAKPSGGLAIHLGRSAFVDQHVPDLAKLDDDGYVIQSVGADGLILAGPTEWGTEFAVDEFLERYVGVRWLLPGKDGTDVPMQQTIEVPAVNLRQEPVYFSRLLSGLRGSVQGDWARRNRMHGRVSFHHNLLHLFPPSKYFATHPEFFPIVNGERYQPTSDDDPHWQPNFSDPGIVAEAVKNIKQYFKDHPEATSYSLGINDGRGYDESPASLARETGTENFLGIRDVSDSYYRWANDVVTEVLKEYPDKWFGCLAYSNVVEPPEHIKVHPRIIPYMTYDRMKWIKPELRAQGEQLTREWHAQSPTLGWYDYAYGSPYCVPRVYFHQMAAYLRFGAANGVKAHYAEIYPNWGEGPKPYLYLKLQWNPNADVDALLQDWYARCGGEAAAPMLAEYYQIWENFWTKTAPQAAWWTDRAQYLSFANPAYLADVDEQDIRRSRQLLDEALAKADTPERKGRVGLLRDAFAYYEASALAYRSKVDQRGPVTNEAEALALLDTSAERMGMAAKRMELIQQWQDDPVLVHPLDYSRYGALNGGDWGGDLIWQVYDWVAKSQKVKAKIEALAHDPSPVVARQAQTLLDVESGEGKLVSENLDLEQGFPPWNAWVKFSTGKMLHDDQHALSGKYSILCDAMRRGGPNQIVKVTPGRYVALGHVYAPEGQGAVGTVTMAATMRGEDGVNMPGPQTTVIPVPGVWITVASSVDGPEEIGGKQVTNILLVAVVDGFQDGAKVWLDDIGLYRLPDRP